MADKQWTPANWLTAVGVAAVLIVPSVGWGCSVSADLAALKQRVQALEKGLAANNAELEETDERLDEMEREAARTGGRQ